MIRTRKWMIPNNIVLWGFGFSHSSYESSLWYTFFYKKNVNKKTRLKNPKTLDNVKKISSLKRLSFNF